MKNIFSIETDKVRIIKDGKTKYFPFETVKGACLKVLVMNVNKELTVKFICTEADKIFKRYNKPPFADRGRDIRSLHTAEGIIECPRKGFYKFTGNFNQTNNNPFTLKQRKKILERDGNKCQWCERTEIEGVRLMIDHIAPQSKGGEATLENGMVLCTQCNNKKSNYSGSSFGKKMFKIYLKIAMKENDKKNEAFFKEIISVFEKHSIK